MNDILESILRAKPASRVQPIVLSRKPEGNGSKAINRYILFMFIHDKDIGGVNTIGYNLSCKVRDLLDDTITSKRDETEIDLWIDSSGGSADRAYKIAKMLWAKCRTLRVVIPDYAKSAATLLALGADKIYMHEAAEMGPLDAQIEHPDPYREGQTISALDFAFALETLAQSAMKIAWWGGPPTLSITKLPRVEVFPQLLRLGSELMKPAAEKIDPILMNRAVKALQIASRYGSRLLIRQIPGTKSEDGRKRDKIARTLVEDYPAHSFVIDLEHARELGLDAHPISEYEYGELAYKTYKVFEDKFSEKKSWVLVMSEADLLSPSEEAGERANGKKKETKGRRKTGRVNSTV